MFTLKQLALVTTANQLWFEYMAKHPDKLPTSSLVHVIGHALPFPTMEAWQAYLVSDAFLTSRIAKKILPSLRDELAHWSPSCCERIACDLCKHSVPRFAYSYVYLTSSGRYSAISVREFGQGGIMTSADAYICDLCLAKPNFAQRMEKAGLLPRSDAEDLEMPDYDSDTDTPTTQEVLAFAGIPEQGIKRAWDTVLSTREELTKRARVS
jgi:hypothetical protein